MNRFMKIIVFFDLPVKSTNEKKEYTQFRRFLLNDGYYMIQYSVYVRTCNGMDAIEKHKARLRLNVPENGSVRVLTITEKQYASIEILIGKLTQADSPIQSEQLSIF